jgi:acyl dehydratase
LFSDQITIDAGFAALWSSFSLNYTPLYTSAVAAAHIGVAQGPVVPFSLLLNLLICMGVECVSESCLLHLRLQHAMYEHPVVFGDTLHSVITVEALRPTASGKRVVVDTLHSLYNQHGKRVFSVLKSSLFQGPTHDKGLTVAVPQTALPTVPARQGPSSLAQAIVRLRH